jgi:hypothetical protein
MTHAKRDEESRGEKSEVGLDEKVVCIENGDKRPWAE